MKVPSCTRISVVTVLAAALLSIASVHATSDDARELAWQDLIPPAVEFDDPFNKLSEDQLYDLSSVALMRRLRAEQSEVMTEERLAKLAALEMKLTESGIDIDYLLAQRERVRDARRAQAENVVSGLDGETIRMPGYVLPLEFDGSKVKEFLLVPFVGACIHTPPPPANQIVHVRPNEGFESKGLGD